MESANDVVLRSTQSLVKPFEPHLEFAATELADMAQRHSCGRPTGCRRRSTKSRARARRQVDRVDKMATSALNGLDRFGGFVNEAVHLPVRQLNGIVAATKAVIETLRGGAPQRPSPAGAPADGCGRG